ncbi:MAG: cupin domain-containing protein [Halioglobus sp.]
MKLLKLLLCTFLLAGTVQAAGPLITDKPIDTDLIPDPSGDASTTERLSRALIHSNEPRSQVMLKSGTAWNGEQFHYPEGEAELTAVRISMQPGHQADFHCHPMPTFGYVASGRLRVETRSGDTAEFKAGDVLAEVMNSLHRSTVLEGPVELLVFYAGVKGQQTTYVEEAPGDQPCES